MKTTNKYDEINIFQFYWYSFTFRNHVGFRIMGLWFWFVLINIILDYLYKV